jgi:hypothetical protein
MSGAGRTGGEVADEAARSSGLEFLTAIAGAVA